MAASTMMSRYDGAFTIRVVSWTAVSPGAMQSVDDSSNVFIQCGLSAPWSIAWNDNTERHTPHIQELDDDDGPLLENGCGTPTTEPRITLVEEDYAMDQHSLVEALPQTKVEETSSNALSTKACAAAPPTFMIPPLPVVKRSLLAAFRNHNPKEKIQRHCMHKHPWMLPPSPLPMRFQSMSHPLLTPLV